VFPPSKHKPERANGDYVPPRTAGRTDLLASTAMKPKKSHRSTDNMLVLVCSYPLYPDHHVTRLNNQAQALGPFA